MSRKWWLSAATMMAMCASNAHLQAQDATTLSLSDDSTPLVETVSVGGAEDKLSDGKGGKGGKGGSHSFWSRGFWGNSDPCEPWTLLGEHCSGLYAGGWINGGVVFNDQGIKDGNGNFPVQFTNMSDGAVLNQMWGFIGKDVDTGGCGFDWGFRVDYVFGVDGPKTQAFGDQGWDFGWNSSRDYGSAIPQLYGEVGYNDLTVKFGHFFTNIGYEVVTAPDNFFYTHALTMFYGEPFTHTGFLADYAVNDNLSLSFGWTNGWDGSFEFLNDASTFLGGVSATLTEDLTATWAVNGGNFGDGNGDIYMQSIVVDWSITDRLSYVFQTDLGVQSSIPGQTLDNEWYGVNNYLFYTLNDCWALGGRLEWFRDDDGVRVVGDGNVYGNYYEGTVGLNWKPTANVTVRPELRFDWFDGTGNPYANGSRQSLTTFGIDGIFTF